MPLTSAEVAKRLNKLMQDMHIVDLQWSVEDNQHVITNLLGFDQAQELYFRLTANTNPNSDPDIGIIQLEKPKGKYQVCVKYEKFSKYWESHPAPTESVEQARQQEWDAAEKYFSDSKNKANGKFRKKAQNYQKLYHKLSIWNLHPGHVIHSFVYINGKIFMIANGEYRVGRGGCGDVKIMLERNGKIHSVKVINAEVPFSDKPEINIGLRVGMVTGEMRRHIVDNQGRVLQKSYKDFMTSSKKYLAMSYKGDKELFTIIEGDGDKYTQPEHGLEVAIDCLDQIQWLHDMGIIHGDIKLENFLKDTLNAPYLVSAIDFGFSIELPRGITTFISNVVQGTDPYIAPEIKSMYRYSFASDVFALGGFFKFLGVPKQLYEAMSLDDFNARPTMGLVKAELIKNLRAIPDDLKSKHAKFLLAEYEKETQEINDWLAQVSGMQAEQWKTETLGKKEVIVCQFEASSAEGIEVVRKLNALNTKVCQVNNNRIEVDKTKLRCLMIENKKHEQLMRILDALEATELQEVTEFYSPDRGSKNIKLSPMTVESCVALQEALVKMQIPFLNVERENGLFMLVLNDNILPLVSDPVRFAAELEAVYKVAVVTTEIAAPAVAKTDDDKPKSSPRMK